MPVWPNSNRNLLYTAITGSVVRTIPHPAGDGAGSGVAPAGVVASFCAVKTD